MLVFISIAMAGIGFVRGAKLMIPFQSWEKFCEVADVFVQRRTPNSIVDLTIFAS